MHASFHVRLSCSLDGTVHIIGGLASMGGKYERVSGTVLGWEGEGEGKEVSLVQFQYQNQRYYYLKVSSGLSSHVNLIGTESRSTGMTWPCHRRLQSHGYTYN